MTGEPLTDLRITRDELRALLLSGEIRDVVNMATADNCSRCGKPYSAHPRDWSTAQAMRREGVTHPLHAFRTQNDVGLWITGRTQGGLVYEPDGRWDA